MKDLHEAICKAAGWPAYCWLCGGRMTRVSQPGGSTSQCLNPECIKERELDKEAQRRWWEEENV